MDKHKCPNCNNNPGYHYVFYTMHGVFCDEKCSNEFETQLEQKGKQMEQLTQGERFVFEWQYRMAGGFNETLALAFGKADGTNFNKLRKGFPEEGEAMWNFANTSGWWEEVQRKAGR